MCCAFGRIVHDAGADGLTVHPRPDERHIRRDDVFGLAELMRPWRPGFELNIEGYPDRRLLDIVAAVKPEQCTLVPDSPEAFTSEEGWKLDTAQHRLVDTALGELEAPRLPCDPIYRSRPGGGRAGAQYRGRRHRDLHRLLTPPVSAGATMRRCCAPAPPPPNAPPNWVSSSISATI